MSFNLAASSSPQPANLRSSTINTWWTALGLTILAFVWRVVDLNRFATWDELFWSHAALRFWRAVALHRPTGAVVALSELTRERSNPQGLVGQSDTIVLPEHRGHRLGMLTKAANLIQVREAAPDAEAILTWNAEENRHMLDVNEALGFYPFLVEGAFQRLLS